MRKMIRNHKNLVSIFGMIIISVITQILVIMKSSIVAGYFGASDEMDSFNLSNSIASFVFGLFASGISTVVIPEYVKKKRSKDLDSFLTLLFIFLSVISFIIIIFRQQFLFLLSKRSADFIENSGKILVLLMFGNFLSSFAGITGAYFQCEGRYNTPKIITFFSNVFVVILLLLFNNISIWEYSIIFCSGLVFNFAFDTIIAYRHGWRYSPNINNVKSSNHLFKMFFPILISTGIYRLSLMVDSVISSRLDAGNLTVLGYSNQMSAMVNTIIVGNLLTYFYPKIVKNIDNNSGQEQFWDQTIFFHAVVCLVIVGFFSIGLPGITVLFEHGKFTHNASVMVFNCSLIYIFGQQSNVIRDLIYRFFYALGNTKVAAKNSFIAGSLNIVVSIVLVRFIGLYGIVLGTIISSFVSLIVILCRFKRIVGFYKNIGSVFASYISNILIMLLTCFVVFVSKRFFSLSSSILEIIIYGIESVVIFCILTAFFNKRVISSIKRI